MAYNKYPFGSTVKMEARFTRKDTGVPYDPTTVTLTIKQPDLSVDVVTAPDLENDVVGHYSYEKVVSQGGEWEYRFDGVGGLTAGGGPAGFTVEDQF